MHAIELAIKKALDLSGQATEANKAYIEFIKADFIVPIEKNSDPENPTVLFLEENNHFFVPVFTNTTILKTWAAEIVTAIDLLKLSGVDLLKRVGENTTICLNLTSPIYKAFNPQELARMRSLILKFFPET